MKNFLDEIPKTTKNKIKIVLFLVGILFVILVAAYLIESYEEKKRKEKEVTPQSKKRMSLLTDKVEKDLWVAAEGQNIKALEKKTEDLINKINIFEKEINQLKNIKIEKQKEESPIQRPGASVIPTQPQMPPGTPPLPSTLQKQTDTQQKVQKQEKQEDKDTPSDKERGEIVVPKKEIKIFKQDTKEDEERAVSVQKTKTSDSQEPVTGRRKHKDRVWLSSGSFMKVRLINGIDAPTSGGAQAEPYPVLMVVKDMAILPNNFRMSLTECFIIGAGYGNISDERAYIKTEKLSCIRTDGQSIDVPLKGHVIGEDGKLGMRGRLINKQGQQIAMAIFSGTLAGLSNALRPQQSMSINLNPTGSSGVQQIPFGEALYSGFAGGVGNALNKVADHYLKMAEKIFPIIEIDAGRDVEVLILIGQELRIQTVASGKEREANRSTPSVDRGRQEFKGGQRIVQQPSNIKIRDGGSPFGKE